MANDIRLIKENGIVKNGSCVVGCKVTGPTNKDFLNTYVSNKPNINDIQNKYDNRFDDPSYYYGIDQP